MIQREKMRFVGPSKDGRERIGMEGSKEMKGVGQGLED